ncbi:hypothetical protein KHA80_13230 [Anaerobacillus sp. HL2]|nr:hypothetical protein KHA80_13230 [Anaerobacillus sp. HL2]
MLYRFAGSRKSENIVEQAKMGGVMIRKINKNLLKCFMIGLGERASVSELKISMLMEKPTLRLPELMVR